MKIGIVSPASLEPLAPYVKNGCALPKGYVFPQTTMLIQELLRRGHKVSLFTLDSSVGDDLLFKGENLTVHVGSYRSTGYVRAATQFRRERAALVRAMREDPCEVLHAHWTYEFALAALTINPAALVTVHDWAPAIFQMQRRPQDRFYRYGRLLMNNKTLARGQHFTAPSPYIAELVQQTANKICPVIPNGLPKQLFSSHPKQPHLASPKIISINNGFDDLKNVGALITTFPFIKKKLPSAELYLVGSGFELQGKAYQWTLARGSVDGIHFVGPQPYELVQRLLDSCDLLIHPSREESFGMTLVEAMAKGIPVIGGKQSGAVPWILAHGAAGVLSDITLPHKMAQDTLAILTNEARWRFLSQAGWQRAHSTYAMGHVVDAYFELYEESIGSV